MGRLLLIACLFGIVFGFVHHPVAHASGPAIISFQGKVVNADGTNVVNGSYNFDFVMYDDVTLGTPSDGVHDKWHELTKSVTVTNGVFQTNLGSATALPDFNANPSLYLAVRFNADAAGYMTPRVQMASTPYALNADKVGGVAASSLVQLNGVQSGNINIGSGTITAGTIATTGLTVSPTTDTVSGFNVTDQTGNDVLNINTTTVKNLLINGSFEGATNGWAAVGGSTLSSSATQALVGTKSMSVATAATNPSGTSYTYPFKANTTYTLSFSAYASSTMTSIFTFGRTINGAATDCTTNTTLTAAWTPFSCTFTTGATVTQADNIYIRKSGVSTPTFFLDGVQLETASSASTYSDPGFSLENLITNASFENSNTNGWALKSGTTPVGNSISASNDFAEYGTQSLKIVTGTSTGAGNGAEYRYQFQPSTQYSLSFWARKDSGSSTAFAVGHQDVSGTDVNCTTAPDITVVGLTTTWTQFTCTFTTGATITEPNSIYLKQTDTAASDNVYVDGVTLVQASAGLSFSPSGSALQIDNIKNNVVLNGNGTGELQPWHTSSSPIGAASPTGTTANREQAGTITANGYIYVIGGYDGTTAATTVYYAKLNADGSAQGWTASANALPTGLRYPSVAYANGYLYVIGGANTAGTAQSSIYYTKMNGDGSAGLWQTSAVTLPAARLGTAAATANGVLYIVGGCTDTTCTTNAVNTIYYGKVTADGSIRGITTPNTLNTNANNLTQNRGLGTVHFANGYLYYIGGSGSTPTSGANATIYYGAIQSDASIAAFAAGTSLPSARTETASAIVNGYLYVIGGCTALTTGSCSSGTATSTVFYTNMNGDGTTGAWQTAINALPDQRGAAVMTVVNNYLYVLGGFDGTSRTSTVFYASAPRTLIAGGLDLVGLTSQGLADAGGAGSLTAGTTRIVGGLTVDGYADFNNGISVDSALNINSITATTGQSVFNINNSSSNSIFSIQHMSANFGSLVSAGAVISNTSTFDEEFMVNKTVTALTADTITGVGDTSAFTFDTFTGTATTFSTPTSVTNGVGRLSFPATSGTGIVFAAGHTVAAYNGTYLKANLPVVQIKIKPSTTAITEDMRWGLMAVATAASGTNDATTTDGIYFSNENGTAWVGVVRSGSANVGTVTCTGTISTAQYSTGRIVVESSSLVHFYMDYDASNGINFQDCGTVGVNTNPTAAMTVGIMDTHTAAATSTLDVDYIKTWQDDAAPDAPATPATDATVAAPPTTEDTDTSSTDSTDSNTSSSSSPLTSDGGGNTSDQMGLIDFLTATAEDTVFNHDVYVHGTLYVDKIKANQIEGLQVFSDEIASLQQELASQTKTNPATALGTAAVATSSISSGLSTPNLSIQSALIGLNLRVNGGLNIGGDSEFHGNAIFYHLVTFVEKTVFKDDISLEGHVLTAGGKPEVTIEPAAGDTQPSDVNPGAALASASVDGNDNAGQLTLSIGSDATAGEVVHIAFNRAFSKAPEVLLTAANADAVNFKYYVTATATGFSIVTTEASPNAASLLLNYWVVQ